MEYFRELCKQENVRKDSIKQYLEEENIPILTEEERERLNEEINIEEIKEAICKQKNNKIPGTDGLPAELYKNLGETLDPTLSELYNKILKGAELPRSWRKAYIILIPKEGADTTYINNYRLISLLNTDDKIFMNVMAERLKKMLSRHIHTDQNGFLPARQLKNNIRTVLDILEYYEVHPEKQSALVFLDAQKAFDKVNWEFMRQQVKEMNFGVKFGKMIESIYSRQEARVVINGETTKPFEIERGVRQGCPLSPLLFIITLEILLRKI
uniref:Reverse transcriptase domain-containing protein n=1 Tax=Micrurus paraensis TaxID=1970185 RepID=A0A2D4JWW4_9SAUR